MLICTVISEESSELCGGRECVHGSCQNVTESGNRLEKKCVCFPGWKGSSCDSCGGRAV